MKRFLLAGALLLAWAGQTSLAQSQVPPTDRQTPGPQWFGLGESEGGIYQIDTQSITKPANRSDATAWVSLMPAPSSDIKKAGADLMFVMFFMDCRAREIQPMAWKAKNQKGELIAEGIHGPEKRRKVMPDSIDERIFNKSCGLAMPVISAQTKAPDASKKGQPAPGRALATQKQDFNLDDFIAAGHRVTPTSKPTTFDQLDAAGIGAGYKPQGQSASAAAVAAAKCTTTLAEEKAKLNMKYSSDEAAFEYIRRYSYSGLTKEQAAQAMCYQLPDPNAPKTLGSFDRWRYESCQTDAAKAPTVQGVNAGLRVCREKFGQ